MGTARLRSAARSALSRISLANALEPVVLPLHDRTELGAIRAEVVSRFVALPAVEQDDEGLMDSLDLACRGERIADYRRGPSPYLGRAATRVPATTGGLSTVVTGAAVGRLVDRTDLDRILARLHVTTLASCLVPAGSWAETCLLDRSDAARSGRRVRLAAGQLLGNPVLWATRTEFAESVIGAAASAGTNRAEAMTDAIGVIFPKYDPDEASTNQRWILHLPASLTGRLHGFRPTFVEAGGYPRFKARPIGAAPPAGWGATLELGRLAANAGLCDGLPELTLWPVTTGNLEDDETVELEYLGAIERPRGEHLGVDCDETVAGLLSRGRTASRMLREAK